MAWIVDFTHCLDERGEFAMTSGPARRLAEFMAAIVEMASDRSVARQVKCRRRPGRKPCRGLIAAAIHPDDGGIEWVCPVCGDRGYISNWQGTRWDRSTGRTLH